MTHQHFPDGSTAWRALLGSILYSGQDVAPRGQPTKEVLHTNFITVDMARAVVTDPVRKLNYRFMCAEALWILSGSNELAPLTKFNSKMAQFSDDGRTLAGAYGPPVTAQLDYVVKALLDDRETRQAALTIWRQNPPKSRDVPCTIAMAFSIRDDRLHQHVFMRSSDAWLGIPYDIFSFSCIGLWVACVFNQNVDRRAVLPGQLTISMTSSHLYERDLENARAVLDSPLPPPVTAPPDSIIIEGKWAWLEKDLIGQRDDKTYEPLLWKVRL